MRTILVVLLFMSLGCTCLGQADDNPGIQKLIEGFRLTLFKGDARGFADLFAGDADFTNILDNSIHGRENIYQHHIDVFKGRPKTRTNNVLSHKVRFLKPDLAAIEIKWDNKHSVAPDGTKLPDRDGVWIAVAMREKGGWLFKVVRNVMLNDGTKPQEILRTN